jgi:hypothetical protein
MGPVQSGQEILFPSTVVSPLSGLLSFLKSPVSVLAAMLARGQGGNYVQGRPILVLADAPDCAGSYCSIGWRSTGNHAQSPRTFDNSLRKLPYSFRLEAHPGRAGIRPRQN